VLLALDTATGTSSVALLDGEVVAGQSLLVGVNPGEVTVGQIDALCSQAGVARSALTGVAVGVGPGPYTSTRIGVAIARTLAFALSIPVYGVCTHDAIAAQFAASADSGLVPGQEFMVATDARRREIYWARYDSCGQRITGPDVGKPAEVIAASRLQVWVGNGLERYPDLVTEFALSVTPLPGPSAEWTARLAVGALAGLVGDVAITELVAHDATQRVVIPADQRLFAAYPLYLRRPDAKLPARAK
jgi:tRNA threonylcarbamoyladenosine biosynthesis protein TsaB